MTDPLRAKRKELTTSEVLREVESGNRVLIESDLLGEHLRLAIREDNGTYYCDTPVKLFTFDSVDELGRCLEQYRLTRPDEVD